MSRTVLILNGSPRKRGNTAYLIDRAMSGIMEKHPEAEVEVVRLDALKIAPCRACDACRREERLGQYCIVQDGMAGLYDKAVRADAIVLACPIYWFALPAQMKLFLDRLYGLWLERTKAFQGKSIGAILVYGDADPYISGAVNAIGTIESLWRYTMARPAGIAYGTAGDIGDAERNAELGEKAFALGKGLFN